MAPSLGFMGVNDVFLYNIKNTLLLKFIHLDM